MIKDTHSHLPKPEPYQRPKLSDGLGGAGGAHGALTNSRDARTNGAEAVRCSAWLGDFTSGECNEASLFCFEAFILTLDICVHLSRVID